MLMKKLLFFMTAAIVALSLTAAPVDQATAVKKAKSYLKNELYAGNIMAPAALNPVLLKAEIGNNKLNQPVYYIFNTTTTYLVVAGDDRAEDILMVGDRPLKDINYLPQGMIDMLSIYKEQIEFLQENPKVQVTKVSETYRPSLNATTIGPLLTALWDQDAPYWNQCKFTYNNTTYQCYTGCPATSASMVLYFWKYPASVGALASYTASLDLSYYNSVNYTYPALPAVTFDWANMKDTYNSYNSAQGNAVATLMRYCGQAEGMMYGTASAGGSGIYVSENYRIADMFKAFGYKSTARNVTKNSYSAANWENLIQSELAAGRPLVYCAVSNSAGGHAFNVDGYRDSDGKYHVNFGWSGDGNNWMAMNAFSDGDGYTFNQSQQAIIGVEPPDGTVTPTPELTVSPTSLSFTGAQVGQTYTKTFTVTGTDLTSNVTISSNNNVYTVSPSTLTVAQAQAGATVTVTYKPTAAGTQNGTITVSSTGAASKTVSVSGTATATPAIIVNPNSLNMSTTVGTPVTQTFTVTGTNLTGSIYLSCSGTGFTIDRTNITRSAAAGGVVVTATYNPTTAGNHTGTVTLTSNGAQTVTVQLNGTAAQPARTITANPTSLTFNTLVGETATKTFTVTGTNLTGALSLTLNNAGGVYSITPSNISVAQAQAGATVTVTYAPSTFGTNNASVTISGGGANPVTVTLSGTANLTKYAPVMLPADEQYINLTKFRADWTDATPAANVASYTLEVSPKPVEPQYELIASLSGTSFSGTNYYAVNLTAPWSGTNVRGHNNAIIYFRNNYDGDGSYGDISYTVPAGYQNATFTMRITSGTDANEAVGNLTVSTPQTEGVTHYFTPSQTYTWLVTASSGQKITITTPDAQYSPDIALIGVYAGDATNVTFNATETGDANYRLITGITDRFYTVENLTAEGTFLYRVKALYIDGTESDWSNIEEVTLFENGHGFVPGDVNHDGKVTIGDISALIDILLGQGTGCEICADVNLDGNVTIGDVSALIDVLAANEVQAKMMMARSSLVR